MAIPDEPRLYALGCFDHPSNIGSQQVRAVNLMWALRNASVVPRGGHVLIVGAGVAGVTAAAAAADLRLRVTVLEKESKALTLFRCSKRHVHPWIYNWPHPRWRQHRLLLPGNPKPEKGKVGALKRMEWASRTDDPITAWRVAEILREGYCALKESSDSVTALINVVEIAIEPMPQPKPADRERGACGHAAPTPTKRSVCWREKGETSLTGPTNFDAIVLAVGIGREQRVGDHSSYWGTTVRWPSGAGRDPESPLLVAGAGDGGLIDAIGTRLGFKSEVTELLEFIEACGPRVADEVLEIEQKWQTGVLDDEGVRTAYEDVHLGDAANKWLEAKISANQRIVYLVGRETPPFGQKTAALHRFLVVRLLKADREAVSDGSKNGGTPRRTFQYFNWPKPEPPLEHVEGGQERVLLVPAWSLAAGGEKTVSVKYADVVVRVGPRSSLARLLPKGVYNAARMSLGTRNELDQTREPLWRASDFLPRSASFRPPPTRLKRTDFIAQTPNHGSTTDTEDKSAFPPVDCRLLPGEAEGLESSQLMVRVLARINPSDDWSSPELAGAFEHIGDQTLGWSVRAQLRMLAYRCAAKAAENSTALEPLANEPLNRVLHRWSKAAPLVHGDAWLLPMAVLYGSSNDVKKIQVAARASGDLEHVALNLMEGLRAALVEAWLVGAITAVTDERVGAMLKLINVGYYRALRRRDADSDIRLFLVSLNLAHIAAICHRQRWQGATQLALEQLGVVVGCFEQMSTRSDEDVATVLAPLFEANGIEEPTVANDGGAPKKNRFVVADDSQWWPWEAEAACIHRTANGKRVWNQLPDSTKSLVVVAFRVAVEWRERHAGAGWGSWLDTLTWFGDHDVDDKWRMEIKDFMDHARSLGWQGGSRD